MTGKITNVSPLCCYMCHSVTLRQFSSWNDCIEQSRITYVVRLMSQPCWMRTLLLIHDAINPFFLKKNARFSMFVLNRFFIAFCFLIQAKDSMSLLFFQRHCQTGRFNLPVQSKTLWCSSIVLTELLCPGDLLIFCQWYNMLCAWRPFNDSPKLHMAYLKLLST